MGTIWTRGNGGTLTGSERIGADKANSGNPADSVHYTTEQLAEFGESQNATVPRPADLGTQAAILAAQGTADNAVTAAGVAQSTANNALPKPGGTTTANGIAYGTGTSGAAVAISTTTIADLVKRLGNVFNLNANTVLDDSYSGGVIFVDTSGGARTLTIPPTVSAGWNAVIVREGANTLNIVGSTVGADTMLMKGPAAVANAVAIAVDDGGVSVLRRSTTKCWCAGKIS